MKLESFAFGLTYVLMNAMLVMLALEPPAISAASPATPVAQAQQMASARAV